MYYINIIRLVATKSQTVSLRSTQFSMSEWMLFSARLSELLGPPSEEEKHLLRPEASKLASAEQLSVAIKTLAEKLQKAVVAFQDGTIQEEDARTAWLRWLYGLMGSMPAHQVIANIRGGGAPGRLRMLSKALGLQLPVIQLPPNLLSDVRGTVKELQSVPLKELQAEFDKEGDKVLKLEEEVNKKKAQEAALREQLKGLNELLPDLKGETAQVRKTAIDTWRMLAEKYKAELDACKLPPSSIKKEPVEDVKPPLPCDDGRVKRLLLARALGVEQPIFPTLFSAPYKAQAAKLKAELDAKASAPPSPLPVEEKKRTSREKLLGIASAFALELPVVRLPPSGKALAGCKKDIDECVQERNRLSARNSEIVAESLTLRARNTVLEAGGAKNDQAYKNLRLANAFALQLPVFILPPLKLQKALDDCTTQRSELESKESVLYNTLKKRGQEKEALEEENEKLQAQVAKAKDQFAALTANDKAHLGKIQAELEAQLAQARDQVAQLMAQIQTLKEQGLNQLGAMEQARNKAVEAAIQLQREVDNLRNASSTMEVVHRQVSNQLRHFQIAAALAVANPLFDGLVIKRKAPSSCAKECAASKQGLQEQVNRLTQEKAQLEFEKRIAKTALDLWNVDTAYRRNMALALGILDARAPYEEHLWP